MAHDDDTARLSAFAGGTALVTGAGDGIGAMLARGFADSGMDVVVQDIREDAAQAVARSIGDRATAIGGDVSDPDGLAALAARLGDAGRTLNVLWLNAGVGVGAPVLTGRRNAIEWGFGVNVLGVVWSMQAFWPLLEAAEGPRHVGFTASSAALVSPEGDFPLYATTKHGTFAVAEALAAELAAKDVPSTILCPGLLNTNIWDAARARPSPPHRPIHSRSGTSPAAQKPMKKSRFDEAMAPSSALSSDRITRTHADSASSTDARDAISAIGDTPAVDSRKQRPIPSTAKATLAPRDGTHRIVSSPCRPRVSASKVIAAPSVAAKVASVATKAVPSQTREGSAPSPTARSVQSSRPRATATATGIATMIESRCSARKGASAFSIGTRPS